MTTAAKPYRSKDPYRTASSGLISFGPQPLASNFTWTLDRDGFPQPSAITSAGLQEYSQAKLTARMANLSDPEQYWFGQPALPSGWLYLSALELQTRFSGDGIIFPMTTQNVIKPGIDSSKAFREIAEGNANAKAQIANWNAGGQVSEPSYAIAFAMLNNYFRQGQAARGKLTLATAQSALIQWAKDSQAGLDMQIAQAVGYTIGAVLLYEVAATAAASATTSSTTADKIHIADFRGCMMRSCKFIQEL